VYVYSVCVVWCVCVYLSVMWGGCVCVVCASVVRGCGVCVYGVFCLWGGVYVCVCAFVVCGMCICGCVYVCVCVCTCNQIHLFKNCSRISCRHCDPSSPNAKNKDSHFYKHSTIVKFRKFSTGTILICNIQSIFKFH